MSEWWTYRPADFLMFSARTYGRLFEQHNAQWWPLHLVMVGLGVVLLALLLRRRRATGALACLLAGAAWMWVGGSFQLRQLATVHWAGEAVAAAFALQGLLLGALGARMAWRALLQPPVPRGAGVGVLLLAWALAGQALFGAVTGRPWTQVQVFGMAPDPTAIGTLGLLLMLPHGPRLRLWRASCWPLPLLWCEVSAMTWATLGAAEAWPLAIAPLAALATVWRRRSPSTPSLR